MYNITYLIGKCLAFSYDLFPPNINSNPKVKKVEGILVVICLILLLVLGCA